MRRIIPLVMVLAVVTASSGCISSSERIECLPYSRTVENCATDYEPVCGHSGFMFKTYPNACMACVDQNVEYYTDGKCLVN
jgi:hypothetical protein